MSKRRFSLLRQHGGFYAPDEAMRRIFTGGPADAAACYRQLASLGDDFAGDRLRGLVVELVLLARRQNHPWRGSFHCANGQPMTARQIALAIGWDPTYIRRDLRRIMAAGLMERIDFDTLPTMEGYPR